MQLGNLQLPKTAALAPMAGVGDRAFREICIEHGACYVVAEMASSKGMQYGSRKTAELLRLGPGEHPCAIQLFGDEPATMADAAAMSARFGPDVLDINMGCPAPKIAGGGSGSALLRNLPLAGEIIAAVVGATDLPVTVKIRKGWDEGSVNAVEAARLAEAKGASALIIHGRTRQQMYKPPVDLDIIAQVKRAVSIPVVANGDIDSVERAEEMYERTGCDLVMIGRGALGAPWLFAQIDAYFGRGQRIPEPEPDEKMAVLLRHIERACGYKGEHRAMREARTHAAHYFRGWRGAAELRRRSGKLETFSDLEALARFALDSLAG